MKKKFITVIIAFIAVFFSQSQVWASSENLKIQTEFNNIQIDKSIFLSLDESPAIIAKRDSQGNNSIWIASIFFVGLGQILMGDLWRGLKFTLLVYGIGIIGTVLEAVVTGTSAGTSAGFRLASIIGLVGYIVAIVFYVFNIIDAYSMSQEQAGVSKLNNDQEMAKMEKDLKTVMDFANSVKVSDSGAVSVRALAF